MLCSTLTAEIPYCFPSKLLRVVETAKLVHVTEHISNIRPPTIWAGPRVGVGLAVAALLLLWFLVPKATFLATAASYFRTPPAWIGPDGAFGWRAAGMLISAVPTALFMAAQIFLAFNIARLRWSVWRYAAVVLGSVAVAFAVVVAVVFMKDIPARIGRFPNLRELVAIAGVYYGPLRSLITLCIVSGATSIGCMVAFRVRDRNLLLPVVILAAFIDLWTVTSGPTSHAIQHAPDVVSAVSAPIPAAGAGVFVPSTLVGPGDFLFLGLVFCAVARLALDLRRNFWYVYAAMTLGMLAVTFDVLPYLPALIVLAAAVALANRKDFSLTKQEKASTVLVALILAALLPVVWKVVAMTRPPDPPSAAANQGNGNNGVNESNGKHPAP